MALSLKAIWNLLKSSVTAWIDDKAPRLGAALSFYTIFALRIRRNDVFNGVTSVLYFVFLLASSMFYPIDPLPRGLRTVALCNPITWEVDVLRYATIGYGHSAKLALADIA